MLAQYHPFPFLLGDQLSVLILKREFREQLSVIKGFKSSCHKYLHEGLTVFLVKKRLSKIKYGFEGSISNPDLGLCVRQANN